MTQPGIFLSHPGRAINPSYHCAPIVVSILSAIKSRLWSENLIPDVPMDIPSETPTVLNLYPTKSAPVTPSLTLSLSSSKCILQGLPSYQTEQMPTWGLFMSSSLSPVAYNIACEAPCDFGCVNVLSIGKEGRRAARF